MERRLMAEWLGTFSLLATVVGSGIMAERLAGDNVAIALLGNTIPTGAILVVLITVFGPVSGAHFNPAVTLAFASIGRFPWREVPAYVGGQVVAALLAAFTVRGLLGDAAALGATVPAVELGNAVGIERDYTVTFGVLHVVGEYRCSAVTVGSIL